MYRKLVTEVVLCQRNFCTIGWLFNVVVVFKVGNKKVALKRNVFKKFFQCKTCDPFACSSLNTP